MLTKKSLILLLVTFSMIYLSLSANASEKRFLVVRAADVVKKFLNHTEATKACPSGTHLPTARDLARVAQSWGAKGILEMDQVDSKNIPSGYYKISTYNVSGEVDEFYFNPAGYVYFSDKSYKPGTYPFDLDTNRVEFWTASIDVGNSDYAYYLNAESGHIRKHYRGMLLCDLAPNADGRTRCGYQGVACLIDR